MGSIDDKLAAIKDEILAGEDEAQKIKMCNAIYFMTDSAVINRREENWLLSDLDKNTIWELGIKIDYLRNAIPENNPAHQFRDYHKLKPLGIIL